ncbi:sigma-54-dependent transcriptional regulator [Deminuibacter soli]|uniref:Sigma-54-dependent Fis family transcriptional regulator n=1 Tax=Deminuibacter soli TaxID=2291815 RepID=A0A3E1NJD0_9BACT|nr:sigma-54 dependent transcriptional regulator [Deminuibacter soli]RFM28039.1 sigma-54-dependent Fis family transcriptional regulator [Deminuibacter soli]
MKKLPANILVIDDDVDILVSARLLLKQYFASVTVCDSPKELNELLSRNDFDIIMLDMNYQKGVNTGKEGLYWLKHILSINPKYIVVLMTAYGEVELAVECLKAGATDFVLKPWNVEKLIATMTTAYKLKTSNTKLEKAEQVQEKIQKDMHRGFDFVMSEAGEMRELLATIRKVAPTDANILILGENGTGKQVVAREIHQLSERAGEVFMHVDLGSLSNQLFESELFGYAKGAFTDAREDRAGRFELCSGGTIFLDEIGNLPLHLQAKLLHVLQNRTVTRLGESKERSIDVRLLCATNMPLEEMVGRGEFREDLLYRINTVELRLPPLRNRKADIPVLVQHFLASYNTKYRKQLSVSKDAMAAILHYHWPGNVRELQHVIERAVIMAEGEEITEKDISIKQVQQTIKVPVDNLDLEEMEQLMIRKALDKHKGNISKAATELGLTRAALYRRMEKFNL